MIRVDGSRHEAEVATVRRFFEDLTTLPELLRTELRSIRKRVDEVQERCGDIVGRLDAQGAAISSLCAQQECLEEASRRQKALSEEHYQSHVVEPLARHLLHIFDLVAGDSPLVTGIRHELLELLATYGVEELPRSETFDRKTMQSIQTVATEDPMLHGSVAKVSQVGFRRGDRILRYHKIVQDPISA